jgi:formamidopyrimidine-DNA glycosylase
MPELPEAERFRKYLESTVLHKRIIRMETRNRMVIDDTDPDDLSGEIEGSTMKSTERHGKYVGITLSSGKVIVLHFGMTGHPRYFKEKEVPDHTTIMFHLDNGYRLAFICVRVLCRMFLEDSMASLVKRKGLGPDALELTWDEFQDGLERRRAAIKTVLMDQHLVAGIGNIYADEILFQSGIHPSRSVEELSLDDRKEIFRQMDLVLEEAVRVGSDWDRMEGDLLLRNRTPDGTCPRCGRDLQTVRLGGRTSYLCPHCQPF